ncbi:MAG: hypothetical protein ACYSSI_05585 [Planctomycetota bacterium]
MSEKKIRIDKNFIDNFMRADDNNIVKIIRIKSHNFKMMAGISLTVRRVALSYERSQVPATFLESEV